MKKAWIDEINCILSFHEIPGAEIFCAVESEFWSRVLTLSGLGFRIE